MQASQEDAATVPSHPRARGLLRVAVVVLLCATVAMLLSVDAVYLGLQRLLLAAEPLVTEHPVLGPVVFVLFSSLSAILAFFSSALLVPAAVYSWGSAATVALLWLGWWLGGLLTYALGQGLRRPGNAGRRGRLAAYLPEDGSEIGFSLVLLWQLALPSEIPGYLCGYLGVRFRTFALALGLAELPYALGAVLLGESVLRREPGMLVALGVLAATLGYFLLRALRRRRHVAG